MKNIFKTMQKSQRVKLFLLLSLLTAFDFTLLAYRLHIIDFDWSKVDSIYDLAAVRGIPTFFFLVWNLFLAWIPYWVSLTLASIRDGKLRRIKTGFTLVIWLLFFPNAPYILTDLLHFRNFGDVPMWYDLMMLLSFAFTGVMLGWLSLMEVQDFLKSRHSRGVARGLTFVALILCSYGIYLGRFQRWNSWDILTNPVALFQDMFSVLMQPSVHAGTLGIAVVLGGFLTIGYALLSALRQPLQ
jgi:uncharacterized membrane protein